MRSALLRRLVSPIARAPYATKPHTPKFGPKSQGPSSKSVRQPLPKRAIPVPKEDGQKKARAPTVSLALSSTAPKDNDLLAPVHIAEDPNGVINERHPATKILANSSIVVQRQLELMNLMIGFEQANKYVILDPQGNHIGYMAEQDLGIGTALGRQMFATHRSFTTHVFNRDMKEVLRFHRPFTWISSRIRVYDAVEPSLGAYSSSTAVQPSSTGTSLTGFNDKTPNLSTLNLSDMRIVGETHQQWAPLRRKFNLFLHRTAEAYPSNTESSATESASRKLVQPLRDQEKALVAADSTSPAEFQQFAYVDERFLSWDFSLMSSDSRLLGSVNRNFAGFGREIFTDTGVYALRMDAAGLAEEPNHMISNSAKNPLAYDGITQGMTLDQRAVMLATAVSIDFDYFSRHSRTGGAGFLPMWFPGGGGEAAEAEAEAEAAEGADATVDDTSPTAGPGANGSDVGQSAEGQVGEGEEVWGNDWNPWDDRSGGPGSSGSGSPGPEGGGGGGDGEGFDIGDWF